MTLFCLLGLPKDSEYIPSPLTSCVTLPISLRIVTVFCSQILIVVLECTVAPLPPSLLLGITVL